MIVTTVVLTNAAQAKCFHSQCRSRMYAVTHQILNLNCILSLEPNGDQWNFGKQHQQGPQNSYPISARGLEGFNKFSPRGLELVEGFPFCEVRYLYKQTLTSWLCGKEGLRSNPEACR